MFCLEMFCPPGPGQPENGNTFCSNGNTLASRCNFTCNPGFNLEGAVYSDCFETNDGDILWRNPVPVCKSKNFAVKF